jgi:CheY-like chemotaxis protein
MPPQRSEGRKPTILLVDDDAETRALLKGVLEDEGIQVVGAASDGAEAVELADSLLPEVVLMDLRMPVLGGLDATRLIKDACPATQVVLLTAFESPALERQAEEAGCFAYVVKGAPPGTLRLVLHQAVACRRSLPPPAGSSALEA